MERDQLLSHFLNTLSADNALRSNSEKFLMQFIHSKGVLSKCLEISVDQQIPVPVRLVSVTFFKNKIRSSWFITNDEDLTKISDDEKAHIKSKLIESIVQSYSNQLIINQLINSIQMILRVDPTWDQSLANDSLNLLKSNSNQIEVIYTSLLLLCQVTKRYKYDKEVKRREFIDKLAQDTFPIFEQIFETFMAQISTNVEIARLVYFVLKIYKYITLVELPPYMKNDLNNLSKWCGYHFQIIDLEIDPELVSNMESTELLQFPFMKCKKWAFANLHRLKTKHSAVKDSELSNTLIQHFLPTILNHYLETISKWSGSNGKFYLTEPCLYHLISLINECLSIESLFQIIQPQITPILKHVIVPLLSTTDELVELFEDDQQEYFRRVYDLNPFSKTSDMAADDFIYCLITEYQGNSSNGVLNPRVVNSLNEVFQVVNEIFQSNDSKEKPYQVEACLRILKDVWTVVDSEGSPAKGQLNAILTNFILPYLQNDNHKLLQVRACENISILNHPYLESDTGLLNSIFETLVKLFSIKENPISLRIESADALGQLCIYYPTVEKNLSNHITVIMSELLELNNTNEFDIINEIMDGFVSKFSKELEPFSYDLAINLTNQFMKLAEELLALENQSNNGTSNKKLEEEINDKEFQLSGILNVLITMVISMNSQKEITYNLLKTFQNIVSFVLGNGLSTFLAGVLELLETVNFTIKEVIPEMWELLELVLDSFDNYGYLYFDTYTAFFQSIIVFGFNSRKPISHPNITEEYVDNKLKMFIMMLFKYLDEEYLDDEYEGIINTMIGLSQELILSLGHAKIENYGNELISKVIFIVYNLKNNLDLIDIYNESVKNYLKFFISCIYINPSLTIQLMNSSPSSQEEQKSQFLLDFLTDWFGNSSSQLCTVLDTKLQVLSLISLIRLNLQNNAIQGNDINMTLLIKLLELLEYFPVAVEKKLELMKKDVMASQQQQTQVEFEIDEDDPEFEELTKEDVLVNVNVIEEFKRLFLDENDKIASVLPGDKLHLLQRIVG